MRALSIQHSDARLPAPERLFLLVVLMVSGTVTLPQVMSFGFMSGLGLWTIAIVGVAWALWLMKPRSPKQIKPLLIPLTAFTTFAVLSALWSQRYGNIWIQLLAVTVGFLGFILLTAREVAQRPWFTESLLKTLDFASVTACVGYTLTIAKFGFGEDAVIGDRQIFMARSFALFALIAVARQLGRWHAGERNGLIVAIVLTILVVLSHSRLGLVMIVVMFPASYALVGGKQNVLKALFMLGVGALGMTIMLMVSDTMYNRFFGFDASLSVGGVSINAMGRTAAWNAMIADIRTPMQFLFGKGAGAGSTFCELTFENLPHPHNDYLRYLYDFGAFGLAWFVVFMVVTVVMLWRRLKSAKAGGDMATMSIAMTSLLSLLGIAASMFTDNSANYIYVMAPLAILLGATLSQRPTPRVAPQADTDWIFQNSERRELSNSASTAWRRTARMPMRALPHYGGTGSV